MISSRKNPTLKTSSCWAVQALLTLILILTLALLQATSSDGFVLQVVGYQNKSHVHVLGSGNHSDPNYLGPRSQIIDVPVYTYPLHMGCPEGQKPDGTGRCRFVWP